MGVKYTMEEILDEYIATCQLCGLNFDETEINMIDYELDLCGKCEIDYLK